MSHKTIIKVSNFNCFLLVFFFIKMKINFGHVRIYFNLCWESGFCWRFRHWLKIVCYVSCIQGIPNWMRTKTMYRGLPPTLSYSLRAMTMFKSLTLTHALYDKIMKIVSFFVILIVHYFTARTPIISMSCHQQQFERKYEKWVLKKYEKITQCCPLLEPQSQWKLTDKGRNKENVWYYLNSTERKNRPKNIQTNESINQEKL